MQLMIEAERRAFADRAEYMGDATFIKCLSSQLTNEKYLDERMKDYYTRQSRHKYCDQTRRLLFYESEETTHLDVIDKEGNAVAVTTTLNNSFGSRTVVGGAGFFLNDEMDDFSIKPGVPNMYGAVGGEANAILPGKRMLSSMTPTIVLKDDKPFLYWEHPEVPLFLPRCFKRLSTLLNLILARKMLFTSPSFIISGCLIR